MTGNNHRRNQSPTDATNRTGRPRRRRAEVRLAVVLTAFVLSATASFARAPTPLIAFSSTDGASDATNISVVAADGTGRRMLTHNDVGGFAPRFTRDGRGLIYWTWNQTLSAATPWRARPDGTGGLPIRAWVGVDRDGISPSGRLVALTKESGIELRDDRGRLVRRLRIPFSRSKFNVGTPQWSPDGRWLALMEVDESQTGSEALIWLVRADGSQKATQLSTRAEVPGPFSPDSRLLLSYGGSGPDDRANVISLQTGARRRLPRAVLSNRTSTAWLRDSQRIAYVDRQGRIETTDINSGQTRFIAATHSKDPRTLRLVTSPTRNEIAYIAGKALYVVGEGSHHARLLARLPGIALADDPPSWRPNGAEIAFSIGSAVFGVSPDGGRVRTIVGAAQSAREPVWAPDRSRIAFTQVDEDGRTRSVYTMNADGSDRRLIGGGDEPAWAPDSRRLAYVARDGQVMVAHGNTAPRPLGAGRSPSWSPDGRAIAYVQQRLGRLVDIQSGEPYTAVIGSALYIAAADGSDSRVLVPDREPGAPLLDPRWSPDGTTIAADQYDVVDNADAPGPTYRNPRLVLVGVPDGSLRKLDNGAGPFAWSPDGTRILQAAASRGFRIATIADGTVTRLFTLPSSTHSNGVSWSTDNDQFTYSRCRQWCELWVANADGSTPRRLTTTLSPDDDTLSWAP